MIHEIIKKERSEVFILHFLHAILFVILRIYLAHLTSELFSFSTFSFLIMIAIFENFHYRALRDLNYTYWTLTAVKMLWILYTLLGSGFFFNDFVFGIFGISILIFFLVEIYLMSSPIYYPRVQWWEYDFRYRGDLKIKIEVNGVEYKSRLVDLRREAGCVISFEQIELGNNFLIRSYLKEKVICFEAKIISIRENIPGRGYRYGVQLILDKDEIKVFKKYQKDYLRRYKVRRRSKFV